MMTIIRCYTKKIWVSFKPPTAPASIVKQIPTAINIRISRLSSSKKNI